jgi:hypothetical protein
MTRARRLSVSARKCSLVDARKSVGDGTTARRGNIGSAQAKIERRIDRTVVSLERFCIAVGDEYFVDV